jgi:hypothetical protein
LQRAQAPTRQLQAVAFDDRVGEQLLAHGLHFGFGGGLVLGLDVELDGLPDADVLDAAPAEAMQLALDRLALHVEHAGFEENVDRRAH